MEVYKKCFHTLRNVLKGYGCNVEVQIHGGTTIKVKLNSSNSELHFVNWQDAYTWLSGVYTGVNVALLNSLKSELADL